MLAYARPDAAAPPARATLARATPPRLEPAPRASASERPAHAPDLLAAPLPPGLTALDALLVRTLRTTLAGVRGAPDAATLAAVIDELDHLSAERPQTAYHVGLLETLGERAEDDGAGNPDAGTRPGWTATHWDWYHGGRLVGWTHQQRWAAVARFYTVERAAAQRLLDGAADFAPWAEPLLFHGLLAADAPALAADALRRGRRQWAEGEGGADWQSWPADACGAVAPAAATPAWLAAAATLLDAADACLAAHRVAEAEQIADALAALEPPEPPAAPPETRPNAPSGSTLAAHHARLRRLRARCAQARGRFPAARAALEDELEREAACIAPPARAALLGDLGLVAGGFAHLGEVRLPEADADPAAWLPRLEAGAAHFAAAAALAPDQAATARFCLGALEWLRERPGPARPHFEAALGALTTEPAAARASGVEHQAQLYFGASILLELDAPARERALRLLAAGLAGGARPPAATWRRLLDLLALDAALAGPLFELFDQYAAATAPRALVHDYLLRCAPRSDAARRRLAAVALREERLPDERWTLLRGLLHAQRRAGDEDGARATLDALETVALTPAADSHALLERWLDFLAVPANYEPSWSWEDTLWSRVHALEILGRDDEAFCLLELPFNHWLAEGTAQGLAVAEDLLARARRLGRSPEARALLAEMTARLRARHDAERLEQALDDDRVAARLRAGRSLRVLFVGGNETQARHKDSLRAALGRRDDASGARVELDFLHPAFNSNWDKTLADVRARGGRLDALVIMPLLRTELGRALRRLASELGIPWVPCTGRGYDSMERALQTALALAAERE